MSGPVGIIRDVTASRRAQRQYRLDLRHHLDAAQAHLHARQWRDAGLHLIAADELATQGLIEKLREPVTRP